MLTLSTVSTFVPGLQTQSGCNFDSWDQWARGVSKNKNVKVFMGVPGNVGAGRGYAPPSALGPVIESSNKLSSFGGVMIWDASQAYTNGNFIGDIKKKLNEGTRHSGRSFHIHVRG
jgi:chitinase